MPELTQNQIADLRALADHCRSLAADLVIIGAIAYQVHFPREDRHTGDIDFAVALDLDEFAELERRLLTDKWIHFANRETQMEKPSGDDSRSVAGGTEAQRGEAGHLACQSVQDEPRWL
jgi:hypothetical protein